MINILNFFSSLIIIRSKPILLFPGLGGSRLVKGSIDIWPPRLNYYLFNKKEWKNNIIYDTENVTTLNFGDKNSLDLHSNLPYIIKKNLFEDIMEYDNTHPIPYDFRLIHNQDYINEFYKKLESYIENFNESINCLTHSSGGLLLHYFLYNKAEEWKKQHINSVINVNVPFAGVIVSLKELVKPSFYSKLISKDVLISLGSLIINLPNKNIIKPILIVDGKEEDYFNYFQLENEKIIHTSNNEMIESFSKQTGVHTIIVYTSELDTPSIISIKKKKINIIKGPGDGTVPLASLLYPRKWKQENLEFYHLPNYEHSSVLFSKELLSIINKINLL